MKKLIKFSWVILMVVGFTMVTSCEKEAVLPTVTTADITSVTSNSAIGGGDVTSDGGAEISARGICYDKGNSMPTTNNSMTSDGTSIGSYTSTMSGLLPNTTYYVRAYATNKVGTSYGAVKEFKTEM